jgi:hypothetical protein
VTSDLLFDKRPFPLMHDALWISGLNPATAVNFDAKGLIRTAAANGLVLTAVDQLEARASSATSRCDAPWTA